MASPKADRIRREIESCRSKDGRLTKQDVVAKARDKRTQLHAEFKRSGMWNDRVAAERARLEFAGDLIRRYITITVINRSTRVVSVGYVRDRSVPARTPGLISLTSVEDADSAERILAAEINGCEAAIRRARSIAAVLESKHRGVVDKLEDALESLIAARSELRRRRAA